MCVCVRSLVCSIPVFSLRRHTLAHDGPPHRSRHMKAARACRVLVCVVRLNAAQTHRTRATAHAATRRPARRQRRRTATRMFMYVSDLVRGGGGCGGAMRTRTPIRRRRRRRREKLLHERSQKTGCCTPRTRTDFDLRHDAMPMRCTHALTSSGCAM